VQLCSRRDQEERVSRPCRYTHGGREVGRSGVVEVAGWLLDDATTLLRYYVFVVVVVFFVFFLESWVGVVGGTCGAGVTSNSVRLAICSHLSIKSNVKYLRAAPIGNPFHNSPPAPPARTDRR
jgi:hypothetical protein